MLPPVNPSFVTNSIVCTIIVALSWSLYRAKRADKEFKLFLWDECFDNINPASWVVGAFILLSGLLFLLHFPLVSEQTLAFFISLGFGMVVHGLARGLNVVSLGRSCAIFALVLIGASVCLPRSIEVFALGSIFGLCWAKLIELRLATLPNPVQDLTPACLWLAGVLTLTDKVHGIHALESDLLAVAICIAFLLRLFQPPFLIIDHLFVKRIALAATGGMVLLVAIVRYFHIDATNLAWLFGFGLMLAYLAEQIDIVKSKDDEKIRALWRTLLIVGSSAIAVTYQATSGQSNLSAPLFLAAAMLIAESSQTAYVINFYWIAIVLLSGVPFDFWAVGSVMEAHEFSPFPFVGGAITIGSLAAATYLSTCMPGDRRSSFDWAEPMVLVCLLAFGIAILMVRSWAPTLGASFLDIALALSIWHNVFFPKNANSRLQCMLFALMLVCLVYAFSIPAGALLPFSAIAAIFRPRADHEKPAQIAEIVHSG